METLLEAFKELNEEEHPFSYFYKQVVVKSFPDAQYIKGDADRKSSIIINLKTISPSTKLQGDIILTPDSSTGLFNYSLKLQNKENIFPQKTFDKLLNLAKTIPEELFKDEFEYAIKKIHPDCEIWCFPNGYGRVEFYTPYGFRLEIYFEDNYFRDFYFSERKSEDNYFSNWIYFSRNEKEDFDTFISYCKKIFNNDILTCKGFQEVVNYINEFKSEDLINGVHIKADDVSKFEFPVNSKTLSEKECKYICEVLLDKCKEELLTDDINTLLTKMHKVAQNTWDRRLSFESLYVFFKDVIGINIFEKINKEVISLCRNTMHFEAVPKEGKIILPKHFFDIIDEYRFINLSKEEIVFEVEEGVTDLKKLSFDGKCSIILPKTFVGFKYDKMPKIWHGTIVFKPVNGESPFTLPPLTLEELKNNIKVL